MRLDPFVRFWEQVDDLLLRVVCYQEFFIRHLLLERGLEVTATDKNCTYLVGVHELLVGGSILVPEE